MQVFSIHDIKDKPELTEESIKLFWKNWGNINNFKFYEDTILNSCKFENTLPRFYIALTENKIAGTYALLMNDFTSRQDLFPWFACFWVDPGLRGNNFGLIIQKHAIQESSKFGFNNLYLCTDLNEYYEKNGWLYVSDCHMVSGEKVKIYSISIK